MPTVDYFHMLCYLNLVPLYLSGKRWTVGKPVGEEVRSAAKVGSVASSSVDLSEFLPHLVLANLFQARSRSTHVVASGSM